MKVLLIVYDNDSYIHFFPQGIAYVAAALKKAGHDVEIYQQDIHHYPCGHLTSWLDRSQYDVVGLGFVAGYYQFAKARDIAEAVNRSRNRRNSIFVLGGHGPAAEPEWFKEKLGADVIVIGEGEKLNDIVIRDGYFLELPIQEIDCLPWPQYDLFPIEVYRLIRWPTSNRTDFCMPILSGRGCPWNCSFCYRMVPGFRPRSPQAVIEEMRFLNREWGINHFQFSDELFMSSTERIQTFCDVMLQAGTPTWAKWDCNGRLKYATIENLKIMKRAGCEYINYGCEAMDDEVLRLMNKHQTVEEIRSGANRTVEMGILPGLNFMWGNPGDTPETLEKAVRFLHQYAIRTKAKELRTIRPVTPYPGSPLYKQAIEQGLLEGPEDFYERKHINSDLLTVNFTEIPSMEECHHLLLHANASLVAQYYNIRRDEMVRESNAFYIGKNPGFRGYRGV